MTASTIGTYNFSYLDGTKGSDSFIGGTGNDTFVGQAGGDSLTGDGGANIYKYLATTDSPPGTASFDIISDFIHGMDKIDFSAIAGLTAVESATSAPPMIAAHTIEIVTAGGNTIIYANATSVAEAPAAADMEVHLTGVTNLTSSDILHP